jgi:hypothetical protein
MSRWFKWAYSIAFFLLMCGLVAAGTYQYKDNLSIPYNINLFACGSASCTAMVLQNSSGSELFTTASPGSVTLSNSSVTLSGSPVSVGIGDGANSTQGAKADSPLTSPFSSGSVVAALKGILANVLTPISVTGTVTTNPGTSPQNVTIAASPLNVTGSLSTTVNSPLGVTPFNGASPQNVTVANTASPAGVAVVNNVAVTPPTPLNVTVGGIVSPQNVTLPASPVSVGIAGPTPLNVTVGNTASPAGVAVVNSVAVTPPTPLQVTLPASPISVGIAGPTPLNVTVGSPLGVTIANSPVAMNLVQQQGANLASISAYGVAPIGSVGGVNAFVTSLPATPLNVTIAQTPLNMTLVAIPGTPINVTQSQSPQNVTIGNTPLNVTLASSPLNVTVGGITSPQNVTIAGPTPLNVTVGSPQAVTLPASPLNVAIAGPTPLAVTLPATPLNVALAGPTPLNVTVGGIVSPQNVTLATGTYPSLPSPPNVNAYVATSAYAVTGTSVPLGPTPGLVGIHQLAHVFCAQRPIGPPAVATPVAAYLQIFDAAPTAVTVGTTLAKEWITITGTPVSQGGATAIPPGDQFLNGISVALTQSPFKSSTAVGFTVDCTFAYN